MSVTSPDPYGHVDDFFGGGVPSIHFDDRKGYVLGSPKGGRILAIRPKQQQTDYKTKKPATWDNGDPKYTLPVEVQTNERNPQDPYDDGRRTLWIDGGKERAVREELKTKRAKLRPGGDLFIAWIAGSGGDGDPKVYRALYTPGAHADADAMFTAPPAQHAAPPAQHAAPQHTAPPQWGAPASPTGPAPAGWGAPAPQHAAPPAQQYAQPPAQPPAGLWDQPAAQPNGWPPAGAGQAPAPAAPAGWGAAPTATPQTAPPAAPAPAQPPAAAPAGPLDPGAIAAAYGHLSPDQQAAIVASGMSLEQIASVYGPPQMAGAR